MFDSFYVKISLTFWIPLIPVNGISCKLMLASCFVNLISSSKSSSFQIEGNSSNREVLDIQGSPSRIHHDILGPCGFASISAERVVNGSSRNTHNFSPISWVLPSQLLRKIQRLGISISSARLRKPKTSGRIDTSHTSSHANQFNSRKLQNTRSALWNVGMLHSLNTAAAVAVVAAVAAAAIWKR